MSERMGQSPAEAERSDRPTTEGGMTDEMPEGHGRMSTCRLDHEATCVGHPVEQWLEFQGCKTLIDGLFAADPVAIIVDDEHPVRNKAWVKVFEFGLGGFVPIGI